MSNALITGTVLYGLNSNGDPRPILVDSTGAVLLDGSGNMQAGPSTGPMVGALLVGIDSTGAPRALKLS